MRLTIEPVTTQSYSTVTVSQKKDDQNIHEVIELIIVPALMAWGYSIETIMRGFDEYHR